MIDINVTNFITVGIMALLFQAVWHFLAGMLSDKGGK